MGGTMADALVAAPSKVLREGSATKRAAILTAARELFVADGFDRTSVDAISARAEVSKRTVYDYFGDKGALMVAVVEEMGELLLTSIQAAIDDELSAVDDLERALVAFSNRIAVSTIGSSDYAALRQLLPGGIANLPELTDHWMTSAPEEAIAERFAELGRLGLLEVPDPRLAADHFVALTFSAAFDDMRRMDVTAEVEHKIVEGVRAFLRAYTPR